MSTWQGIEKLFHIFFFRVFWLSVSLLNSPPTSLSASSAASATISLIFGFCSSSPLLISSFLAPGMPLALEEAFSEVKNPQGLDLGTRALRVRFDVASRGRHFPTFVVFLADTRFPIKTSKGTEVQLLWVVAWSKTPCYEAKYVCIKILLC